MALPEWLTKDVGPLPVWGWITAGVVGVGGGVALWRFQNRAAVTQPTGADLAELGYGTYGGGSVLAGGGSGGGASNVTPAAEGFSSNVEWRAAALSIALANGFSALAAEDALGAYFEQRQLTAAQAEVIDLALSELGLPPSPPTINPPDPGEAPVVVPDDDDQLDTIVIEAYRDILGRDPDAGGFAYWRGLLASGALSFSGFRQELKRSAESGALVPAASGGAPAPAAATRTYTVRPGDSLSKIAAAQLGSGNRWPEIHNLNKDQVADPNLIYPGQVLRLP